MALTNTQTDGGPKVTINDKILVYKKRTDDRLDTGMPCLEQYILIKGTVIVLQYTHHTVSQYICGILSAVGEWEQTHQDDYRIMFKQPSAKVLQQLQ